MDAGLRLAARLKALRQERRVTQMQMAERLGISQATLARLEAGNQNVTLRTLSVIARSLRCDVVDLLRIPEPGKSGRESGGRPTSRRV